MMLQRCPKISPETGIRTKPPEETLKDVLPLLGKAGLGEPEDITSWGDTAHGEVARRRRDGGDEKIGYDNPSVKNQRFLPTPFTQGSLSMVLPGGTPKQRHSLGK